MVWCVEASSRLTCDFCGTSLKSRDSLVKRHINAHVYHQENRHFHCQECSSLFTWKRGLVDHTRSAHGVFSQPQKCRICERVTKNANALRHHFKRCHTSRNRGKRHVCKICGKTLDTKYMMGQHLKRDH